MGKTSHSHFGPLGCIKKLINPTIMLIVPKQAFKNLILKLPTRDPFASLHVNR